MRVPERFWWLRLVVALAYVLAVPLFLYWYIVYIVPYDFFHRTVALSDGILAFFIVCALLTLALHAALSAWLELQRTMRRAAALAGDQDALPLARNAVEKVADHTPRTVVASYPQLVRYVIGKMLEVIFLLGGVVFFGDLLLAFILLPFDIHILLPLLIPNSPPRPTANPIRYPYLVAIVIFGAPVVGLLRSLSAELGALPAMAARIQVGEDGITHYSFWGRRRFFAWRDARLLEVAVQSKRVRQGGPLIEFRRYSLYGGGTVLRWVERHSPPGANITSVFERIAPAVRLYTGLPPRTLDPAFLAPGASLSLARFYYIVARLPWWLVYTTAGTVILSRALVDRTFIVVGLIYACIGVFAWLFSKAEKRSSARKQSSTFIPVIPFEGPSLSSGAVYEMTVGSYHAFVTNQVMFVILSLLAIGFPLYILGALFAQFVLHVPGLHLHPLPPAMLLLLFGIMILGVVTIIVSMRAKDTVVLADATGLRKRWVMGSTFLPWGEADYIERRRVYGVWGYYVVYGRNGRTRIVWPKSYYVPSRRAQERGAILTDPDGMAALVARQIGQPIQERR